MNVKSINVFHWLPRILCILAILFVSMFALGSFAPKLTVWQQIGAFFIHLIPSFLLVTIPFVVTGILFIVRNYKKKRVMIANETTSKNL